MARRGIGWIFETWKRRDPNKGKKIIVENLPWNIYGDKTVREHLERFRAIHIWIKYRIVIPLVKILYLLFKKHIVKEVPDEPYNANFKIFERAFDNSLYKFAELLLFPDYNIRNELDRLRIEEKMEKSHSIEILRMMKDVMMTVCLYDTAYREFLNILLYNITIEMNKYYKKNKLIHIPYLDKGIYDVSYKNAWEYLSEVYKNEEKDRKKRR